MMFSGSLSSVTSGIAFVESKTAESCCRLESVGIGIGHQQSTTDVISIQVDIALCILIEEFVEDVGSHLDLPGC